MSDTGQATAPDILESRLQNSSEPKTELEHYAARRILKLEAENQLAWNTCEAAETRNRELEAATITAQEVLEYATYHDGRYGQMESHKWQSKAQKLVGELSKLTGKKPYEVSDE